jgi:TolB-like protein/Flp pilus assembly protein TadD
LALVFVAAVLYFAYRARQSSHAPAPAMTASTAVIDKSVAVLPFLDLSENKDEGYFADGMSEELINLLTQVPDLRVPARTSSFYFKSKQATLPEIARTLGVSHVLEGSVRKSGDTLRITAQLVRANTGYHEWSETFDRPMADVFKIQDDIAAEVVRALKASLLPAARTAAAPTTNSAAYTLYLRAQALELGGGDDDYALAEKYIRQSLALDPNFAAAWAGLAQIKVADEGWSDEESYKKTCAEGRQAIDQALKLNSALADSHRVLANLLYVCDWNWTGAEAQYQRALEIDPNRADTLRQYATLAWFIRQPDKATERAQRAVARDPLDAWSYNALALARNQAGQIGESVVLWQKALALDPTVNLFIALLTNALVADGRPADALAEIEREPNDQMKQMNLPFIYEAMGRHQDADRALAAFEKKYGANDPLSLGEFYACRNDVGRALGYLERAVAMHFTLTDVANRQACLNTLEHTPRYRDLLRKMNLA